MKEIVFERKTPEYWTETIEESNAKLAAQNLTGELGKYGNKLYLLPYLDKEKREP